MEDDIDNSLDEKIYIIVMPAADKCLDSIYRQERPTINGIRFFMQEIGKSLEYLHNKGKIHGDLKLSNILRLNNRLKITDFDATVKIGEKIGIKVSSGYLPPEMIAKAGEVDYMVKHVGVVDQLEEATPQIDFWAFGIILFALCSEEPFLKLDRNDNTDKDGLELLYNWTISKAEFHIFSKV